MKNKVTKLCLLLTLTGCTAEAKNTPIAIDNSPNIVVNVPQAATTLAKTAPKTNQKPIIQQLTVNPTDTFGPDDVLTFKAMVHDPDPEDTLSYSWSNTKGTLSSTQGVAISWRPRRSDGGLETGVVVVTLTVTDNRGGIATAAVNVHSRESGSNAPEAPVPANTAAPPPEFSQPAPTPTGFDPGI